MKKKKRKGVQHRKLIDTSCESNSILLLKNLSQENHKILATRTIRVAILSDDIAVDDGWSITSTFLEKTVKQLVTIWEGVLSEVFN